MELPTAQLATSPSSNVGVAVVVRFLPHRQGTERGGEVDGEQHRRDKELLAKYREIIALLRQDDVSSDALSPRVPTALKSDATIKAQQDWKAVLNELEPLETLGRELERSESCYKSRKKTLLIMGWANPLWCLSPYLRLRRSDLKNDVKKALQRLEKARHAVESESVRTTELCERAKICKAEYMTSVSKDCDRLWTYCQKLKNDGSSCIQQLETKLLHCREEAKILRSFIEQWNMNMEIALHERLVRSNMDAKDKWVGDAADKTMEQINRLHAERTLYQNGKNGLIHEMIELQRWRKEFVDLAFQLDEAVHLWT